MNIVRATKAFPEVCGDDGTGRMRSTKDLTGLTSIRSDQILSHALTVEGIHIVSYGSGLRNQEHEPDSGDGER